MQRLDHYLSSTAFASRKEWRQMLQQRRITVNGTVIESCDFRFDETTACVRLDGQPIVRPQPVTLMLHKPAGYITATKDANRPTVMAFIPAKYRALRVFPVGRLDKETEGLLLFTNDGHLAHKIMSPSNAVVKKYYAEHAGCATQADIHAFENGVVLKNGTRCLPAVLQPIESGKSFIYVQEGKKHQVRRMMRTRGLPVSYLRRVEEGGLALGNLALGQVRELSDQELQLLWR